MLRVCWRRCNRRWGSRSFADGPIDVNAKNTGYAKEWRKPWNEREGWYASRLSAFQTGRKSRYLEMVGLGEGFVHHVRESWSRAKARINGTDQEYLDERVHALGADLAAAFFYCHRGGTVKMYHNDEWIKLGPDKTMPLPNKYTEGHHVEKIDLEHFLGGNVQFEGLKHLQGLANLKWLSLKNNPYVDDWCLDFIVRVSSTSLEYLDISGCSISYRGLMAMFKFEQLKCVVVSKHQMVDDFELACSMIENENPKILFKVV